MAVRDILLLGHPDLYAQSTPVRKNELAEAQRIVDDLHDTLIDFRQRHGFGRAIAAPQIGEHRRIVYMHIGRPVGFINPELSDLSSDMIELYDDCMSFPGLLVRVQRHRSCRITFRDLEWNEQSLELEGDLSELLQHECDHLDGILAIDRAMDARSLAFREYLEPTE